MELKSVSYDQFRDIPSTDELGINTKIIFSDECYLNLCKMIEKTKENGKETGTFL